MVETPKEKIDADKETQRYAASRTNINYVAK
jgi:hypothetical protein